jgi:hypothetical protein
VKLQMLARDQRFGETQDSLEQRAQQPSEMLLFVLSKVVLRRQKNMSNSQDSTAVSRDERAIYEANSFVLPIFRVGKNTIPALSFSLLYQGAKQLHCLGKVVLKILFKIMALAGPLRKKFSPRAVNVRKSFHQCLDTVECVQKLRPTTTTLTCPKVNIQLTRARNGSVGCVLARTTPHPVRFAQSKSDRALPPGLRRFARAFGGKTVHWTVFLSASSPRAGRGQLCSPA